MLNFGKEDICNVYKMLRTKITYKFFGNDALEQRGVKSNYLKKNLRVFEVTL